MSQHVAQTTPIPKVAHYITQLNAMRGLAALVVVVYHVHLKVQEAGQHSFLMLFDRGYLSVDLFFILSGFVLMYVYAKNATFSKLSLHSYLTFISKRAARIFPVHWLVLFVLLVLEVVKFLPSVYKKLELASLPFNEGKSVFSFFTNLLLIQNWGISSNFTWNVPAWSISAEWFTYLLAPLLIIGLNFFKGGYKPLLGWSLFYTLMTAAYLNGFLHVAYQDGNIRMMLEFLMGGCLCLLFQQLQQAQFKGFNALGFDLIALGSVLGLVLMQACAVPDYVFPAMLSLLILCVALAKSKLRQILSHSSLFYLGEISFSLYLVHNLLVIKLAKLFHLGTLQADLFYLLATLGLSTLIAHFMYKFVEIPVRDFLNAKFSTWLTPFKRLVKHNITPNSATPPYPFNVNASSPL